MKKFRIMRSDLAEGTALAILTVLLLVVGLVALEIPPTPGLSSVSPTVAAKHEVPGSPQQAVPVLCYHFVREVAGPMQIGRILGALFLNLPVLGDMDVWRQTTSSFDQQMAYLYGAGYQSIDLDELREWQQGERELPEKSFVITFDDGDRSVLDLALPILRKYNFKATLFVVTARVGDDWEQVEGLTWSELKTLQRSGYFSIESHTNDMHYKVKTARGHQPVFLATNLGHHNPPRAASRDWYVIDDLRESRRLLRQHLGVESRFLAWPYGFANKELDKLAIAAGFDAVCTLTRGDNSPLSELADGTGFFGNTALAGVSASLLSPVGTSHTDALAKKDWDPVEVKRYTITARTSIRTFQQMLAE